MREGALAGGRVTLPGNIVIPLPEVQAADGPVTVGVRAAALRLQAVPAGPCEFVVLPMPLHDADGAPCRAFVGLADDFVGGDI